MPALAVMLLLLVIFVLTLENSTKGVGFYLLPKLSKLDGKVINGALPGSNGPRVEYREHPLGAAHFKQTGQILPDICSHSIFTII